MGKKKQGAPQWTKYIRLRNEAVQQTFILMLQNVLYVYMFRYGKYPEASLGFLCLFFI